MSFTKKSELQRVLSSNSRCGRSRSRKITLKGSKYSFFAVHFGKVLVAYDNHSPKGHHRQFGEEEGPYDFNGFEKLREDFKMDLATAAGAVRKTR